MLLVFFFVMLVFFFVVLMFFFVMLVVGCVLRIPKHTSHKYQTEKKTSTSKHNNTNNIMIVIRTQSQASQ